ncbi:MAG: NTP transferase domain-containing protein [bacterium]
MSGKDEIGIILAAGKGTRMKSELPKVLHEAGGKPLVLYPVDLLRELGAKRILVVLGHGIEQVRRVLDDSVETVHQEPQLGTGHAVMVCAPLIEDEKGDVVVLYGDMPFLKASTIRKLLDTHREGGFAATILTAITDERPSYGRIVRGGDGTVLRIVEAKDATDEELKIREVNSGTYCFRVPDLLEALRRISDDNAQGEYYLTDAIGILRGLGGMIGAMAMDDPDEILGVNTVEELKDIDRKLRGE